MDGWKRWLWLRLERALYAVLPMDEWEQDTVNIDKAKLQCPICTQPLKPPIFQCVAGHLACGACHGQFPNKDRCYKCAHPGGYSCSFPLEDVIRSTSAKIYCPECCYYTSMTYNDHQAKCLHAPCRCSEPGCAFVGSPVWLPPKGHAFLARKQHRLWRGMQLQLPASEPRCLLVAKEDMRVFVVSVGALGDVSLACLRRTATVGLHYTCMMWVIGTAAAATGKVSTVSVEMEVPSSAVAGEAAATEMDGELEAALVVQSKMLDGPSMELHLNVIIDKVQT